MEMRPFERLTSVATARRRLWAAARPIERTETLPVEEAFGRIAATTVRAPFPVPSFARTTWDGYALRSIDTANAAPRQPIRLRVVGEVFAEQAYPGRLGPGEAVAIATGSAIPRGADSVIIFEETERLGPVIRLHRPVTAGERIDRPGHDFERGAILVRAGEELTATALGTVAACGVPTVPVFARPVVAILPNGNELLVPGARPRPGRIYESNNATLAAAVSASGGIPRPEPPLPDDPAVIETALRSALVTSDAVLATGGSSVGERDHLPRILPRLGRLLFHGIAVRAGKPTLASRAGSKLIIGLPGHPTSCLVNMYWLVNPALRRIARRPGPGWTEGWAVLGSDAVAPTPGLATVVPLRFDHGRAFTTYRGSSAITSLAGATAFAMLPPGRRVVRSGQRIRVFHLNPPLGPPVQGSAPRPGGRAGRT
ncbi:MAG TPA: molybdopterin molybdotransferase MoeA [Thermoplasmata archaeon]|nr:molybdopterin molybdotransferase MoeA [Thermoplasmata archaeon]